MIASNNDDIDVDELMVRVRDEVAAMRAAALTNSSAEAVSGGNAPLPQIVVDLSRHAVITELIEDAARMSRPRSAMPARFERRPAVAFAPLVRFGLRVLNYAFKDQRHVNAATQQALRELQRLSVAIGQHVAQLGTFARDQRNTARDMASLDARLAAVEQRGEAFVDRYFEYDARLQSVDTRLQAILALETAMTVNADRLDRLEADRLSDRIGALEEAMTVNAGRLDGLEADRLSDRIGALEEAMTVNAGRLDRLETNGLSDRVGALENAATVNAGRIAALETKPVDERLLGLETAHTVATMRLERLEAFREESHLMSARLEDTRRDLSNERERALRNEASLRTELTATLRAATSLAGSQADEFADRSDGSSGPAETGRSYDEVHRAIADRFRGDSSTIRAQLERYVSILHESGSVDAAHPVVDIGSGSGDWLAALKHNDIAAFGVDTNPLLVARAQEDGLDVRIGDGVAVLRSLPAESIGAVTAFHVLEHLPFEEMIALFDESLRALVPGGAILCETPNPANVTIGSCNFYLDPTHQKPLPSPLVRFMLELRGFKDVRVVETEANDAMRLGGESELTQRFNDFFYGAQNYAVIARKPGESV